MTEIRTDELALVIADSVTVQLQLRFDLFIARHEDPARLPMALFEVLQHCLKLLARGMLLHPKHFVDETSGRPGAVPCRFPAIRKRATAYPGGTGLQAKRWLRELRHRRGPR